MIRSVRITVPLLFLVLGACRQEAPVPRHVRWVPPVGVDIGWWPYGPPMIEGGEIILGVGGRMQVVGAPPGAAVELYRSELGQGRGPCDFPGGICAGILEPELAGSGTADVDGVAQFELDDAPYPDPVELTWQALVLAPDLADVAAFSEPVVRHVGQHPSRAATRFVKVTLQAGLTNTFTAGNTHTGGVAFVDYNNDYWPDLWITNGGGRNDLLYRNEGDGTFTNVSSRIPKPDPNLESAGVGFADIDNDGDLDVMVAVDNQTQMISSVSQPYEGGPNLLWVNNGDGTFTESAAAAGVLDPRGWRNSGSSFEDFDRDGCIDLYLLNWAMAAVPAGDNFDRLLRGNCDGTFTDVTAQTGADGHGRDGLGSFWWDADFDGFPELYVANNSDLLDLPDFDPKDVYYKNLGGVGFEDWTDRTPTVGGDAWAGMGMDVGDIDGDGDWDLYITDVWELPPTPHGNVLYEGSPDGSLSPNRCHDHGLCFGYNSWPANFQDYDNDGWVDLWVGSSVATDPDLLYINTGDGTGRFEVHRQDGWSGHWMRGGGVTDYDGDGAVDVFMWELGGDSSLWRNELPSGRHWIELRLIGTESNAAAIGAVVRTRAAGLVQMRRVSGGDSAHSQADLAVHFGLGGDASAEWVEITWPSGRVHTFEDVPADRFWLVHEDLGLVPGRIVDPTATWDPGAGLLRVSTATNYGGRAKVAADGLGPLLWDATVHRYQAAFPLASPPVSVRLTSDLGGADDVPVEAP